MRDYVHQSETLIDAPIDEVFDFFSNAQNLERLTPPSLKFKILSPMPIEMKPGAVIEYEIRMSGVPFRWLTEIMVWDEGKRFVDIQRKGPYAKWEHEHSFTAEGDSTRMRDVVIYQPPGFFLAPIIDALFVGKKINEIFRFRDQEIHRIFKKA